MTNRWLGLFFACFGLLLLFVVIPRQTEVIAYGWMRPHSLPNAAAFVIAAAGAFLVFRPRGAVDFEWRKAGGAALYLGLIAAGVYFIALFGFEVVAPLIAMAVMLLAGERRPAWLALGAAGIPFVIWLAATVLLDRPLP